MRTLRSILMALASLAFLVPAFRFPLDPKHSLVGQIIGRMILASTGVIILYVEWWTIKNRSINSRSAGESANE